jgi:chromosome segregation ATPase
VLAVLGSLELRSAERVLAEQQLEKAKRQFEAEQSLGKLREEVAHLSQQQAEARAKEIPPEESIRVAQQRLELAENQLKKLEALKNDPQTNEAIVEAELEQQRLLIRQIQVELDESRTKLEAARETQQLAQRAAELDILMAQTTQENLGQGQSVARSGAGGGNGQAGREGVGGACPLRRDGTRAVRAAR